MQRPKDDAPHLDWALYYASLGWSVFPVQPGTKTKYYRYPQYKNPKTGSAYSWINQATNDSDRIRQFWKDHPDADIGMATGDKSGGVAVLDIDTLEGHGVDGPANMARWQQDNEQLPATLLAISGSGSRHYFFKLDGAKNATGVIDGVDIRGKGGYVILPPTADGRHWETPPGAAEIAPAAGAVKNLLEGRPDPTTSADKDKPRERFKVPEEAPEGHRHEILFKMACSMQAQGHGDDVIRMAVCTYNDLKCIPPLSDEDLEQTIFTALDRYDKPLTAMRYPAAVVVRLRALNAADAKRYSRKDKGNSALFADVYQGRHRYCPEWKEWAYYDGRIWTKDTGGLAVRQSAKELYSALMKYAGELDNEPEYAKHVAKLGDLRPRETMIRDAQDEMPMHAGALDADPLMLNVQNGVLDLNAGARLLEHSPEQLLSKMANVSYDPDACCPAWLKFLDEIMEGDADKIAFLQKFMGLSLTGDTREETMVILYGPSTRNGKSTFVETFKKMLGDYADTIAPESLAVQTTKDSRRASGDIAKLAGVRLVITSEAPRNMPLDSARIKAMLGRDTITARQLYQTEFSFVPSFKLIMNTNYLPGTSDDTIFASGRVNVVRFNRHFNEDEQDKTLLSRLQDPAELAGILNWALEGLAAYRREGLTIPESIRSETDQYRAESDKIATFIDECMAEDPSGMIKASWVYQAYCNWTAGEKISGRLNRNTFYAELKRRGIEIGTATVKGKTEKGMVLGYRQKTGDECRYWPYETP